jgi:hypothetical protein
MPLPRLSDRKSRDGMVTIGAMRHRITIEGQGEIWAHVSIFSKQGEFTAHYVPGIRTGMTIRYKDTPFFIERVIELGNQQQMKLLATEM